jgi:IS1 family transposase
MNKLSFDKRVSVVSALVEGNSIAFTCRMTGVAKMTVLSLLALVGESCDDLQDRWMRDLPCKRVQVDEIWSFVGMKAKNVPVESYNEFGIGDVWTYVAIDADTKLVPCWQLGWRDEKTTNEFVQDLSERMAGRIQLTSDGLGLYPFAVEASFRARGSVGVDYAMQIKKYGEQPTEEQRRYSPGRFVGVEIKPIFGEPDTAHISTSYIERQNLNIRMFNRRMTRLTNAFSKKVENHAHQLAINFAHHNFCRILRTTRATPAMLSDIVSEVWNVSDLVKVAEEYEITRRWPLAQAS